MSTIIDVIGIKVQNSIWFRFCFYFIFGFIFFLPCLYLMVNIHQTFATMEEANIALSVGVKGMLGTMRDLYLQYSSKDWNRSHFLGLFWDTFVLSVYPMPRSLRIMRLIEVCMLSSLIGIITYEQIKKISTKYVILGSFFLISKIFLSVPLAIAFAAIYELEGCILSLLAFYFFQMKDNKKYFGLVPLLLLIVTKETFVLVAIGIALYFLVKEFI